MTGIKTENKIDSTTKNRTVNITDDKKKKSRKLTFKAVAKESLYSRFLKIRKTFLKKSIKVTDAEKFNKFLLIAGDIDREKDRIFTLIQKDKDTDILTDQDYIILDEELKKLNQLEYEIIEKFSIEYLYNELGGISLEYIGILYGMSRERVRQIEYNILRKLRSPYLKNKIYHFKEELYD